MNKKKIILDFVKKHNLMVLSTVTSECMPEAAVVEFGQTDDLEIIFDTLNTSRKYANLKKNKNIALVIGWDEEITVQYEGGVIELKGEEKEKYKKLYFSKNSHARKWEKVPEIVYFKVIPKWIRYSDLKVHPWHVFEVNF